MEMEIIQSLLNLLLFPLTVMGMCFILPPYWVFKISSFLFRSLFPEDVKGKVVLITGASSGIGEHVAYSYAKRGARLALVARREDRLLCVAEKARELGSPDTLVIPADVSKVECCDHMVQKTFNHFGRVDHLVNNAGVVSPKLFEEFCDTKEMNCIMDVNFWGTVNTTRFALPHLRRSKGKIVVVSSAAYWFNLPTLSIYSGSKGALMSLFDTLRIEIGSDVKITLVDPGLVETEMTTVIKSMSNDDAIQFTNERWTKLAKSTRLPMAKVKGCAEAIVRSVCRGDRYMTEPKGMLAFYFIKIMCPDLLEFLQRRLNSDDCNKLL